MEPTFRRDYPHIFHRSEHHLLLIRSTTLKKRNVGVGKIQLNAIEGFMSIIHIMMLFDYHAVSPRR